MKNVIMEKNGIFKKVKLALVVFGLTLTSCSDENSVETNPLDLNINEVALAVEIDAIEVVFEDIIIDAYQSQESSDLGRTSSQLSALPDCVTVTIVLEQNFREVTLDFGTVGCMVHGHLLKGQIVFSYTRNPEAQQVLITYDLINFYFDTKNVIGSRTLLKELSNENGNPQFTHTLDLTVIWPNGAQASREGTKVREWIEGFGSGVFIDNVFEITGDWSTTFVNGNSHTYEVILPLRREVICNYFVSGSIDIQRTNFGGVFDYGDGECDNQATFTFNNGEVVQLTLN